MKKYCFQLILFVISILMSQLGYPWGERGHDLVTRIAVRDLSIQTQTISEINRPFSLRAHMLSHLSNVPDIVWRADYMSAKDRELNVQTHSVNFDLLAPLPKSVFDLEIRIEQVGFASKALGLDLSKDIGTAPWRVIQLQRMMSESLTRAGEAQTREAMVAHVNEALLVGGIMSHFVGDLANPHHTSVDRDGFFTGNGGLHYYFESALVDALSMDLAYKISEFTRESPLYKTLLKFYSEEERKKIMGDPALLIFALILDSHHSLDEMVALDDQYSLVSRSKNMHNKAVRRPASEVAEKYEDFVVRRIAIGATVLSQLWLLAWETAGKPDLSNYHSYDYPVKPAFIPPDYLQ